MAVTVLEVSFILALGFSVLNYTLAILKVVPPTSVVPVLIGPGIEPLPFFLSVSELSDVLISTSPGVNPSSVKMIICPFAFIGVA